MRVMGHLLGIALAFQSMAAVQRDNGATDEGGGKATTDCGDKTAAALASPSKQQVEAKKAVQGMLEQGKIPADTLLEKPNKTVTAPTLGRSDPMGHCTSE